MTDYAVPRCPNCRAPIANLRDGACPHCNAPLVSVAPAGGAAPAPLPAPEGVLLLNAGRNVIMVIKVVREHTGLGLKEAKDLVDRAQPPGVRIVPSRVDGGPQLAHVLVQAGATLA